MAGVIRGLRNESPISCYGTDGYGSPCKHSSYKTNALSAVGAMLAWRTIGRGSMPARTKKAAHLRGRQCFKIEGGRNYFAYGRDE